MDGVYFVLLIPVVVPEVVTYGWLLSSYVQNVLRAPKSGVVKSLPRKVGSHLKVDDVIAEFD